MARKKQPRRKPGTGAIRHKPGRALPWEAAFPLGHNEYRYDSFQTRSEAEAFLDRLVSERDSKEMPRNISGGSQRVRQFVLSWLAIKQPHVKAKTFAGYQYLCELASGEIGGLRIDEVTRQRGDELIAYFHRQGFKNVSQMRAVLLQAFEYAVEVDYIKSNPFQRVKVPEVERRQGLALTETQRAALLAAGATEDMADVPLGPIWHLYSRLGLRKGEGMGLRWADVDWTAGTISIVQQYTNVGNETVQSTPKTKKSRRVLPVPADILELLRQLRTEQVRRAASDPDWQLSGLIFTDAHGARLTTSHVRYRWGRLKKRAGIPGQTTIHDLRHTALTLIELSGTPANVVQAIAGHASATMTRHYTAHAGLDDMRRALGG